MALLNADHKDRLSAALSVAGNRASKVRNMRGSYDYAPQGASRNELELYRDVLSYIADGPVEDPQHYRYLANVALSALPGEEDMP